jgi:hypothetical protein
VEGVQCCLYVRTAGCILKVGYEFEGKSRIICSLQKCLFIKFEDFFENLYFLCKYYLFYFILFYFIFYRDLLFVNHIAEISEKFSSLVLENVFSK